MKFIALRGYEDDRNYGNDDKDDNNDDDDDN